MFSQFLRRPALAIVISIIILFLGGLSIKTLPISQFPSVAPPSVVVAMAFPGASANVLVDSVLVILEQAINGVADMRYMASAATSAGEGAIQIIFEPGTDPNVAVLNVQNRIQTVKNRLPPLVEREGIIVMQAMTSISCSISSRSMSCRRFGEPAASAARISWAIARTPCECSWISKECALTT